jgi:hypothetical protein
VGAVFPSIVILLTTTIPSSHHQGPLKSLPLESQGILTWWAAYHGGECWPSPTPEQFWVFESTRVRIPNISSIRGLSVTSSFHSKGCSGANDLSCFRFLRLRFRPSVLVVASCCISGDAFKFLQHPPAPRAVPGVFQEQSCGWKG